MNELLTFEYIVIHRFDWLWPIRTTISSIIHMKERHHSYFMWSDIPGMLVNHSSVVLLAHLPLCFER
jgi:hypothetical protein